MIFAVIADVRVRTSLDESYAYQSGCSESEARVLDGVFAQN